MHRYDPGKHHRRSIRLKGHDYAGGGTYFVTVCAHRKFIAATGGRPFADASIARMIAGVWEEGTHEGRPYVVMPDHFHGLIRLQPGSGSLGDIVGAFKSRVVHAYIQGVRAGRWPPFPGKIWHRNYYEEIVHTAEDEERIAEYIRMNPWRCVTDLGNGLRGMGNPALWSATKLGILCSRNAPCPNSIPRTEVYLGGFHSPVEKLIFEKLLAGKQALIWCPAWGLDRMAFVPGVRGALEGNRMLILEMRNREGNLAAADERNRFVLGAADALWLPHVAPGGNLARQVAELAVEHKMMRGPVS